MLGTLHTTGLFSCWIIIIMFNFFSHYTVNACLFPLCAAHGLAITTVEGVGNPKTGLHEVQVRGDTS